MTTLTRTAAAACTLALVGTLSACGSSSDKATTSTVATPVTAVNTSAPLYNELPDNIKQAGKINVGSEIGYPPMEYYDTDGKTVLGFDHELSELLAAKLGVPMNWQNSNFDGLITQLQSNRVDMVMASMMDSAERQQKVDFVDYYTESSVILTKQGNPDKLKTVDDLCGKTVTVQRGTTQESVLDEQTKACTDKNQPAITILPFDKESDALLQVKQGRAVATVEQGAVAAYNVQQSKNSYEVASDPIPSTMSPTGMAVSKENTQLRNALQKALQSTMDDGSYEKALEKYGLGKGKLSSATINAGK